MIHSLKKVMVSVALIAISAAAAAQMGNGMGHSESRQDYLKIYQPFQVSAKTRATLIKDGRMKALSSPPSDSDMPYCILENRSGKNLSFVKDQKIEGTPVQESVKPPVFIVFNSPNFAISCKFKIDSSGVIANANKILDKWILINAF